MGFKILILASEADLPVIRLIETSLRPIVREGLVESVSWNPEPTADETSIDALLRMGREAGMVVAVWSRHSAVSEIFRGVLDSLYGRMVEERLPLVPVWVDATERPLFLSATVGVPFDRDDMRHNLSNESSWDACFAQFAASVRRTRERDLGRPPRPLSPWDR